jgi:hypothetical protein
MEVAVASVFCDGHAASLGLASGVSGANGKADCGESDFSHPGKVGSGYHES